MPRAFACVVLLSLAPHVNSQFLHRMTVGLRGFSSSSSFVSSSTWMHGEDGHMHQQVQETRTEVMNNGHGTQTIKSKVTCADGLCEREVLQVAQPAPGVVAGGHRMPHCLRAMLERLMRHGQPMGARIIEISAPLPPPPHEPVVVMMRPAILLRGFRPMAVAEPQRVTAMPYMAKRGVGQLAVAAGFGALAVFLMTLAVASLFLMRRTSARESPLSNLAEPLAPVCEEEDVPRLAGAAKAVSVAAEAAEPAKEEDSISALVHQYLAGLYTRAQEQVDLAAADAEKRDIQQYVGLVYQRALA